MSVSRGFVLVLVALFLITLVTVPSVQPVHAALSWSVEIVDANAKFIGNGCAPIAVDSNNTPHIGYDTRYATLNGSTWAIQEIPGGWVTDLKLDTNDNPHMFLDRGTYVRWTGSEWYTQTIPSAEGWGYVSLALDSFGNPHVAYGNGEGLKYASWTGSSWSIQTVDASYSENNFQLSLALDRNNVPYILYVYANSPYYAGSVRGYNLVSVNLAVLKESGWSIEPVLASSNLGDCWNMVLDSKGYPHFLATQRRSTILHVSWDGSTWNAQTVVSDAELKNRGFLALDSHDNPNIVYADGDKTLMYAKWIGADWNIQAVPTNVPTVTWTGTNWDVQKDTNAPIEIIEGLCYLTIDSNGNPHISFRGVIRQQAHWQHGSILYATANGTPDFTPPPTTQPPSTNLQVFPLLIVTTAAIILVIVAIVYVWKKKTQANAVTKRYQ